MRRDSGPRPGGKIDAAVDDERYGGGGAGEYRGSVAAGVAGVDDPGAERPRLARDRDEHAGGGLGAGRDLGRLDSGRAGGRRERPAAAREEPQDVPARGEAREEKRGLALPPAHPGAEVQREQPHGGTG